MYISIMFLDSFYKSMMEVELRAKVDSEEELILKLEKTGAKFLNEKELTDYYFGDIGLYKKIGHSFRIRIRDKGNSHVEMAYKGPTKIDGVYEESEFTISDKEQALELCKKMGLDNPITISKRRKTYIYNNINICLDVFHNRGTFLELEILSENIDKTKLYDYMKLLGISEKDTFNKGYITIFLEELETEFKDWIKN